MTLTDLRKQIDANQNVGALTPYIFDALRLVAQERYLEDKELRAALSGHLSFVTPRNHIAGPSSPYFTYSGKLIVPNRASARSNALAFLNLPSSALDDALREKYSLYGTREQLTELLNTHTNKSEFAQAMYALVENHPRRVRTKAPKPRKLSPPSSHDGRVTMRRLIHRPEAFVFDVTEDQLEMSEETFMTCVRSLLSSLMLEPEALRFRFHGRIIEMPYTP